MLKYMTAGESHGEALAAVIEGIPAGLELGAEEINTELFRRQQGFGRGLRMKIESDKVKIISGVRWGVTTGAPVCLMIANKDYHNSARLMSKLKKDADFSSIMLRPRPGHADLAGMLKYARTDFRDILERSSARETASRVAVGAVAKKLLGPFDIQIFSHTVNIGGVNISHNINRDTVDWKAVEASSVRCADKKAELKMVEAIKKAIASGDTVGGIFELIVKGCPVGLGSHISSDSKLDARLAAGLVSIQAVKGVEFGLGFGYAFKPGSKAHDEIFYDKKRSFYRNSNNAGGFEGGITNGEDIIIRAVMKPIASLSKPLKTVNLATLKADKAEVVRSDACAVSAASVVAESVCAWEILRAFAEKFGGDSLGEMQANYANYRKILKQMDFIPKHRK